MPANRPELKPAQSQSQQKFASFFDVDAETYNQMTESTRTMHQDRMVQNTLGHRVGGSGVWQEPDAHGKTHIQARALQSAKIVVKKEEPVTNVFDD